MANDALSRPWPELALSASFVQRWRSCRRAAFWHTWWSWGGWKGGQNHGTESRRLAYALKGGVSTWTVAGSTVHRYAARAARLAGHGRELPDRETTANQAVADYRETVDKASRRSWKRSTKRAPILLDSFYGEVDPELVEIGADRVRASVLELLVDEHLQVLSSEARAGRRPLVHVEDPIRIDLVPELEPQADGARLLTAGISELVRLWLVPDLAYTVEAPGSGGARDLVIVDWKTGRPKPEHLDQLRIYGSWAMALAWSADRVLLVADYLQIGEVREVRFTPAEAREAVAGLVEVVAEVLDAVEGDSLAGELVPRMDASGSTWPPLAEDDPACKMCDYRRLCRRG